MFPNFRFQTVNSTLILSPSQWQNTVSGLNIAGEFTNLICKRLASRLCIPTCGHRQPNMRFESFCLNLRPYSWIGAHPTLFLIFHRRVLQEKHSLSAIRRLNLDRESLPTISRAPLLFPMYTPSE
jgi:hypothetical protein